LPRERQCLANQPSKKIQGFLIKNTFLKEKKNILFIVPDGVGIRNYLYSGVITHLKDTTQLYFWTTLPNNAMREVEKLHKISIDHTRFSLAKEPVWSRIYRESATYARLQLNAKKLGNPTVLTNWSKNRKSWKLKLLYFLAETIGKRAAKKYDRILKLEAKAEQHWKGSVIGEYKDRLEKIAPDSIFISHQRVASLIPICIAASRLNIKVISCIYSWDNTSKASLAVRADKYLAWSDYMKDELAFLYPEISKENIIVTGTPQFEFYFEEDRKMTKDDFAEEHELDPSKKWICFSGDDVKTSPHDPAYLEDLAEAINKIPIVDRPQIIFRRCPVDVSKRYDEVISKHPDLIKVVDPLWHSTEEGWGAVYPKQEDISLLVNLVLHCDLVVNVGSTVAHDFAVFDKPCFFINYDKNNDVNWSVKTIYNFQHFKSMGTLDAVGWFNNKDEIKDKVLLALSQPHKVAGDRKKWMEVIVRHPLKDNAQEIATVLIDD
jgi:hypothetical protein